MTRHALIGVAVVAGLVGGALVPLTAASAAPTPAPARAEPPLPPHTVIDVDRYTPRHHQVWSAGPTGMLHQQDGAGIRWTTFAGNHSSTIPGLTPTSGFVGELGAGSDIVPLVRDRAVELRNLADGTVRTLTLPGGHRYMGTFGETVLTYSEDSSGGLIGGFVLHRLTAAGTVTSQEVAARPGLSFERAPLAADARTVVLRAQEYVDGNRHRLMTLDLTTGRLADVAEIRPTTTPTTVALGEELLAWHSSGQPVRTVPRDTPGAAPRTVPMPNEKRKLTLGIAGPWLIVARHYDAQQGDDEVNVRGMPLTAVPLTGGTPLTLLPHAEAKLTQIPGGDLVVAGGKDAQNWEVRRLAAPDVGGGAPTLTTLATLKPARAHIQRLSLANGTLATRETDSNSLPAYVRRPVTTDGERLTAGNPSVLTWATHAPDDAPWSAGDGRVVRLESGHGTVAVSSLVKDDPAGFFRTSGTGAQLTDISGRYALVNTTGPAKLQVGDLGVYQDLKPIRTKTAGAASVWGTTLWTQSTTAGRLTAEDLKSRVTATLTTGAPCVAKELQAVGRWLYWSCGPKGPAGVWDRTARKNIPVPSGDARIGDGFLVRHDLTAGKLLLTEFRDGTAGADRTIGELTEPSTPGQTWSVDKFGGGVAYIADDGRIRLAPTGVATERLAVVESESGADAAKKEWRGRFALSRPASTWTLRIERYGKPVRTLSGTGRDGTVRAAWDGRNDQGKPSLNGSHTWTLTVRPANGQGPDAVTTGAFGVDFGAPLWRDHGSPRSWPGPPDGRADLLSINAKGVLGAHFGNGAGGISGVVGSSGWPTTATVVPTGDLNGDRCNDLFVRIGSELRAYRTDHCGTVPGPRAPYTSLGKTWGQFNVLTSPGDLTGDGRPDLVARQTTTGDMYLYAVDGKGKLTARGRIGTNWKLYRSVFGAGDLNGDGIGDLLAVDKTHSLWRYDGTAAGGLKARALVLGKNWATGRDAFVGVGDLTGDGRADLVSRNATGQLLRNSGNGAGSFGSTVRIGAGWTTYKGVF
ncbi:FG-GAP repeat domain-containing protein [Streptomyces sp. NPDC020965]|uniref:FG-GAP repeat domain-containing protein n=1 Tax=Streptomyces sp. NPDC020965 TaxID=3365105 RepID=UPI0037BAFF2E